MVKQEEIWSRMSGCWINVGFIQKWDRELVWLYSENEDSVCNKYYEGRINGSKVGVDNNLKTGNGAV